MFHIIDDEDYIRDILEAMISRMGHHTQNFSSGNDYLTFMNSPKYTSPTAILTDYMMPGMNGYELIQHVRDKFPLQKIVLVSGTPERQESEQHGLCYTLQKPFKMDMLDTLITALINCHEKHANNGYCPLNKPCIFKL